MARVPGPGPELGPSAEVDNRLLLALWWYVKCLAVPWVADRFLCLWIALEVLWDRDGRRSRSRTGFTAAITRSSRVQSAGT
ncbi:MAG: hypothetical protein M3O70_15570, partial [Actinomycetota bacterium]|nr:hypothetical protein [Actinomycetota bacterium]